MTLFIEISACVGPILWLDVVLFSLNAPTTYPLVNSMKSFRLLRRYESICSRRCWLGVNRKPNKSQGISYPDMLMLHSDARSVCRRHAYQFAAHCLFKRLLDSRKITCWIWEPPFQLLVRIVAGGLDLRHLYARPHLRTPPCYKSLYPYSIQWFIDPWSTL